MNAKRWTGFAALSLGAVVLLGGCFLKNEEGTQRVILKKGWQCGPGQDGWVAVPLSEPKAAKTDSGTSYCVLATHNLVPAKLDGWYALSPDLAEKSLKIKPTGQKTPEGELWPMKDGRGVPKEKDGWIGVALSYPKVEGGKLATLGADQLIPKEMDGWVAIDVETMAKLQADLEMGKVTVPPKEKK